MKFSVFYKEILKPIEADCYRSPRNIDNWSGGNIHIFARHDHLAVFILLEIALLYLRQSKNEATNMATA